MKIDILSETTLKITLTCEEMDKNKLCCRSLSAKDGKGRKALGKLLSDISSNETAALAVKLLEDKKHLLLEAFPKTDGGCMVYLSDLEGIEDNIEDNIDKNTVNNANNKKEKGLLDISCKASPLIFETQSGEDLGLLCRCLLREKKQGAKFKSRLYAKDNFYRLAITPQNLCTGRIMRIMKEYGNAYDCELTAAFTCEYYHLIAEKEAVKICSKLF